MNVFCCIALIVLFLVHAECFCRIPEVRSAKLRFLFEVEFEEILIGDAPNDLKMKVFQLFMENPKKEKELELESMKKEKELELESMKKEKELELESMKKEKEIDYLKHQLIMKDRENEIKTLARALLESQSACTSRGIFEFVLKGIFSELNMKGNFNAKAVCDEFVKCKIFVFIVS
jgi:hypothetical protein